MLTKKEKEYAEAITWLERGDYDCMAMDRGEGVEGRWQEDAACFDAFARDVDSGRYDKHLDVPLAVLDEMSN